MVASRGIGDASGIKGSVPDRLSRPRGHDEGARDVFPSILSNVLVLSRAVTMLRGLSTNWYWDIHYDFVSDFYLQIFWFSNSKHDEVLL